MSLITQLKTIPDPRGQRGKRYPLWLLMFLALLGSLCSYWGYRPLAKFCSKHQSALAPLLESDLQTPLLPSSSTFRRLFLLIEAQAWVDAFNVWALSHAPEWAELDWAIDGKSIRCTSSGDKLPRRTLLAWCRCMGKEAEWCSWP
ncbi:transposase family protein [Trichocoleus sp. FACHB-591]|uniref:transposase family protein n=1 Tax=Trichocoleus sp. FACHB-591 TaxID=2692872 RepID=UPI001681E357|nr:transposase family protein [Trichocoleus sp. FACHB-591]MBD2097912.1 transposase family protein [Trichocoleus sp. FACHB-591]